jgi:hypothetical protein
MSSHGFRPAKVSPGYRIKQNVTSPADPDESHTKCCAYGKSVLVAAVDVAAAGAVVAIPVVGGLHHRYERRAV